MGQTGILGKRSFRSLSFFTIPQYRIVIFFATTLNRIHRTYLPYLYILCYVPKIYYFEPRIHCICVRIS